MLSTYNFRSELQFFVVRLFFASINFEIFSPVIKDFSAAKYFGLLYILVSLFTPIGKLFTTKNIAKPLVAVLLLFFTMVASSFISMSMNVSFWNSTIFSNIIFCWLLFNHSLRDPRVFKEGLLWFVYSSAVLGVLAFFGVGVELNLEGRLSIFGDNANSIGAKMAVAAIFLLVYCLNNYKNHGIRSPWLLLLLIPIVFLLLATASRLAFLMLAAGFVLFIILKPTKHFYTKLIYLLIGVVVSVSLWNVILEQNVLFSRLMETTQSGNVSGRDKIWDVFINVIEENPIIGIGFTGHYNYKIPGYYKVMSPHNVFIEVLLYSGVVGLMFFLNFLYFLFKSSLFCLRKYKLLGPLLMSIAMLGVIMSGQVLGFKIFWVIAAYILSSQYSSFNLERNR